MNTLLERKLVEEERRLANLLEAICVKNDLRFEAPKGIATAGGKLFKSSESTEEGRSLNDEHSLDHQTNHSLKVIEKNQELLLLQQTITDLHAEIQLRDSKINEMESEARRLQHTVKELAKWKNTVIVHNNLFIKSMNLLRYEATEDLQSFHIPKTILKQALRESDRLSKSLAAGDNLEIPKELNDKLIKSQGMIVTVPTLSQEREQSDIATATATATDTVIEPETSHDREKVTIPNRLLFVPQSTDDKCYAIFSAFALKWSSILSNTKPTATTTTTISTSITTRDKFLHLNKKMYLICCLSVNLCSDRCVFSYFSLFYDRC
jgi:hypothetical protein